MNIQRSALSTCVYDKKSERSNMYKIINITSTTQKWDVNIQSSCFFLEEIMIKTYDMLYSPTPIVNSSLVVLFCVNKIMKHSVSTQINKEEKKHISTMTILGFEFVIYSLCWAKIMI